MKDKLLGLLEQSILIDKIGNPIGRDGRIRVHAFIDLLSPVHQIKFLNDLSSLFVDYIKESCTLENVTSIIAPKRGNALLVKKCSDMLNKNSGFIRENSLFDKRIEGSIKPGDRVLLADGVGSDGELLSDCVKHLRSEGVFVQSVVVLVNRKEGDNKDRLKSIGVKYKYLMELNDQELIELQK